MDLMYKFDVFVNNHQSFENIYKGYMHPKFTKITRVSSKWTIFCNSTFTVLNTNK